MRKRLISMLILLSGIVNSAHADVIGVARNFDHGLIELLNDPTPPQAQSASCTAKSYVVFIWGMNIPDSWGCWTFDDNYITVTTKTGTMEYQKSDFTYLKNTTIKKE
ncbi:hypothetical protein [Paraburkholderia sediminicola]|uniref:hypothetical protein n=1 Tax=Paraburkholderia sediminicola TaxID=458836 RepID=UPI0038BCFEEC